MENVSDSTIIIVEDDPDQLHNLCVIFSKFYTVLPASKGAECLEMCKSETIDGIITDFTLPDYDGFELIDRVRLINDRIPIVLYTAHNSYTISDFDQKLTDCDTVHYIQKPATIAELCTQSNSFFKEQIFA